MEIGGFVREEIKASKKAVHGGEVWKYFNSDFIDFSSNINPLGPSKRAIEAVSKSMWKIAHYPDTDSEELKRALSDYLNLGKEKMIVGNGSTEIIKMFSEAFLRHGDTVVISEPTFSEYEVYSKLYGAGVRHIYTEEEGGFRMEAERIIEAIDAKTRVVFICNPNNPTGRGMDRKDIERVIEEAGDNDSFVFLDEAYIEFADRKSLCSCIDRFENLFILRSLTKFFALGGLRLGYGVGNERVIEYLEKLRLPWNTNVLAQIAAVESLKDAGFIEKSMDFIRNERRFVYRELSKNGLKTYEPEANFFLIGLRENRVKAGEIKERLIEKGMLIRDCSSFKGLDEHFIRASVRRRKENIKLIEVLEEVTGNA